MMLRARVARGFTLLELMIVMVLLAVLGSISLPVYQGYITDAAADTFLAEVAEFERFYRMKAAEKNLDFCAVTWSDLDAGSADKVGYPSSSFMKVERIDANLNRKSCGSDPVARSQAGGNPCDGLSIRVSATSETDGMEAVKVAQTVFDRVERQGMLKDWSLNTESIVVFTVNFRHGCEGASAQSQSSPTSVGATKSPKAQSAPAKTVCSAPAQRLGDQCVTPVACVGGRLSADLASCTCSENQTLYEGRCVQNARCGVGGALAADPSQCRQCGSGMHLNNGVCAQGKSRADCVRETTVKGNGRPHWSAVASCMGRNPSEWQAVKNGN